MKLPDDWICPSRERCLCGSICEMREAMDSADEPLFLPGEAYASAPDEREVIPPPEPTPTPTDTGTPTP